MKQLIINGDDLGLTSGVSDGIMHAFDHGIVTSTSALMNTDHIGEDLPRASQAFPHLGIGVHMVITEGHPLLPVDQVPSLVDENGCFFELHHETERIETLNLEEVKAEWRTQIETFMGFSVKPDHLDSHHHISYFNPDIFKVMLELASEYNLPIRYPPPEFFNDLGEDNIPLWLDEFRVKAPAACIMSFYGEDGAVSKENMLKIIQTLAEGTYEVMCHPGYADQELVENCSYSTPREKELEILTSAEVIDAVEASGVSLVRFSSL